MLPLNIKSIFNILILLFITSCSSDNNLYDKNHKDYYNECYNAATLKRDIVSNKYVISSPQFVCRYQN